MLWYIDSQVGRNGKEKSGYMWIIKHSSCEKSNYTFIINHNTIPRQYITAHNSIILYITVIIN